jgi:transposase
MAPLLVVPYTVSLLEDALVRESGNQELVRLRKENEAMRASMAALQKQLEKSTDTVAGLSQQLKESLDGNAELRALLIDLQAKLDELIAQRKKRNRDQYGPKTERHNPRPAMPGAKAPEHDPATPKTSNHKKHILDQNLPTEPVPYKVDPADAICPTCVVETVFVGYEITYQLEKMMNSIKRLQHEQEIRACPKCKQYIVTAEKPCSPIPGGLAGPCLLATTITDKCADGLPQYRQSKIMRREDAIVPRSTLCDWFQAASLTLEPLFERLKKEVLSSKIVQTDDCPVKIQNRKARGTMRKGKMTVYRGDSDHPFDVFDFSPDLSFVRNHEFLRDYRGYVQADAAGGFDALFKDDARTEVGCNAHSRRKFYELCDDIIEIYRELYNIERQIRGKPPAHRLAVRRRKSKPLSKKLHKMLIKLRRSLHPTHALMSAVEYTLKHWIALNRFLGNPDLEIDNNGAERAIKDFVLSRKNFLFIGSDAAGKAMAINLSFVVSCKRNGLNPVAYLTDVFTRINSMKTSELDQLLPDRWAWNMKNQT